MDSEQVSFLFNIWQLTLHRSEALAKIEIAKMYKE